jgi:hypothetical protein
VGFNDPDENVAFNIGIHPTRVQDDVTLAKVKLSLSLIENHVMKTCGGSGGIAPYIIKSRH